MSGRILVVEDDPTMAEVLVAYLRRAGYRTESTGTATRPCCSGSGPGRTW